MRETPLLCDLTLPQLSAICRERGLLLLQAHPFRTEQYHSLKDTRYFDGIEINTHDYFPSGVNEAEALRIARERNLVLSCGGDVHYPWMHLDSATYVPGDVHDSVGFASYLRQVKIPYYSLDEIDRYVVPPPKK